MIKTKKQYKKSKSLSLFLISLVSLVVLFYIVAINTHVKRQVAETILFDPPISIPTPQPYPVLSSVLGASAQDTTPYDFNQTLSAQAALVMDNDSKVILFAKNPKLRLPMASTTKIMTALTALDYYSMDSILTIQADKVVGAIVGFKKGERFTFGDLLYAMMLPSGNDAAIAIAQNYPRGEIEFVKKMNERAQELHLLNTHFLDASGVSGDGDYTTVFDLAHLTSKAMDNEIFAQIVATKNKVISDIDGKVSFPIYNLNKLLGVDGVNGVKTGYTDQAGQVLVTSKEETGHTIITVVMASSDRFLDTQKLLGLISGNITYLPIRP